MLNDLLEADPDDPASWLEAHCEDPALRTEVRGLLRAYEGGVLSAEDAAGDWVTGAGGDAPDPGRLQGQTIGPYRLTEEIGVGGMSVVYRAERTGDYEQTVAVKLLQRRLHASGAEQRFRAERQVLASLDHPHIAGLLDGGVTEGGRPYLVMELVDGVPITEYADEQDLDLEARLDLLEQVLDAVEAAHRQLVVHRDLKPSNVLVTETEKGTPHVKLLDFGIAKLLDDSLPVTRPQTATGHHLMTPAYAAPEQVAGEEITTATDVYQLGVLAYELLAGTRPFDLAGKSLTEIERILREVPPAAPSNHGGPRAAALAGDLDTIVQTALRKEPGERYRSVEALAADLGRSRRGEPIAARTATLTYRARKFVGRNTTAVSVAATFLILVLTAGALLVRQRNRAQRSAERARQEAETAEQVSEYLVGLFQSSNPKQEPDTLTAQDLLRRGQRQVAELQGQPAVRAQMLGAIGRAHMGLANYPTADSLLQRAYTLSRGRHDGPDPVLAKHLSNLGTIHLERGQYAVAESLYAEALSMRRTLHEAPHPKIANHLRHVAFAKKEQGRFAVAESLYHEALAMHRQVFEAPHAEIANTINNLGQLYTEQDRYHRADSLHQAALSMRKKVHDATHPKVTESLNNLAIVKRSLAYYAEAESLHRKALAIDRERLGPDHGKIAIDLSNLAIDVEKQGQLAEAESLKRAALNMEQRLYRNDHPSIATSLNNLGVLLRKKGDYAEAETVLRRALERNRRRFEGEHHLIAFSQGNLAQVLHEQGRNAEAAALYRETLATLTRLMGEESLPVATTLDRMEEVAEARGNRAKRAQLTRRALSIRTEALGPTHPETAEDYAELAAVLVKRDSAGAAVPLYRKARTGYRTPPSPDTAALAAVERKMGETLRRLGRYAAAESLLTASRRRFRALQRKDEQRTVDRQLLTLYEQWEKPGRAAAYRDTLRRLYDTESMPTLSLTDSP
jgi:serine/threonine-protein kinase